MADRILVSKKVYIRMIETILDSAFEWVEIMLPTSCDYTDFISDGGEIGKGKSTSYISKSQNAVIAMAGSMAAVVYARFRTKKMVTGDHNAISAERALELMNDFENEMKDLIFKSWKDKGESVTKIMKDKGTNYNILDVLDTDFDSRKSAKIFYKKILAYEKGLKGEMI